MGLTKTQVEAYDREGYLSGIRVAEPDDASRHRAQFDELERVEGVDKCQKGILDRHHDLRFIWELATNPNILDCIEALMGPDILLLATHAFCKYGGDGKWVAWHQDLTYWGLEPNYALTAWYAIDDSDVENGCMRVIPGSHRFGIMEHGKAATQGNLLSINQQVVVAAEDEATAADLILKAGEISIHDGSLIHGSLPNNSVRRRCGMTIRYVPPYVRPAAGNSLNRPWRAILVRGEDNYRHFGETAQPFS